MSRSKKTVVKTTTTTTTTSGSKGGLTPEEVEQVAEAFKLFDFNNTGKVNPAEIRQAMEDLQYDLVNPTIYEVIVELDTPQNEKGVDYQTFLNSIDNKMSDKSSKDGVKRIYNTFTTDDDGNQEDTITVETLTRVSKDLGEDLSPDELQEIINRCSSNGKDLTFEEFYEIMTKQSFP
jgi:Ca2+-binding EF-hand superfamily protein